MTVRATVRAAEPTAAFSPQRKCKTVWRRGTSNGVPFKSRHLEPRRNKLCLFRFFCKKARCRYRLFAVLFVDIRSCTVFFRSEPI